MCADGLTVVGTEFTRDCRLGTQLPVLLTVHPLSARLPDWRRSARVHVMEPAALIHLGAGSASS
jgi:hypothetical protein